MQKQNNNIFVLVKACQCKYLSNDIGKNYPVHKIYKHYILVSLVNKMAHIKLLHICMLSVQISGATSAAARPIPWAAAVNTTTLPSRRPIVQPENMERKGNICLNRKCL